MSYKVYKLLKSLPSFLSVLFDVLFVYDVYVYEMSQA